MANPTPTTHQCAIDRSRVSAEDIVEKQGITLISADNPLRLSYFKSSVSIKNEKKRHLATNRCVIHPYSKFRAWYEIYLVFLYGALLVTKPLNSGFLRTHEKDVPLTYFIIVVFLDVLCWIDIIMNFFTGYDLKEKRMIELRMEYIAKHYVCSLYFYCDVLSSLPKPLLYTITDINLRQIGFGVMGLLGFLKTARVITFVVCIMRSSEYLHLMSKGTLFTVCSIVVSSLIVHWMACLQFFVPRLVRRSFNSAENNRDSWLFKQGIDKTKITAQYLRCFFRSGSYIVGTRLPIERHDLPEEYILAIVTYWVGKLLVAFIWIILAVAILNSRRVDIKFAELMNQLEEYMSRKQLPLTLHNRILQYFMFKYRNKYFKEEFITDILSSTLKSDVDLHMCKILVENVSLFKEMSTKQISKIVVHLIPEVFLPNDIIVQAGTHADAMFFLSSGTVAVYSRSGKEICHLQDGAHFGEVALVLKKEFRAMTVVAIEASQIFRLRKRDLDKYLLHNKQVMFKLMTDAENMFLKANRAEEEYQKALFEQTYKSCS
ncbi:hypothetical protein NQ315_016155 [Exocentrus adspersus]|uniref:Cyclic nucleotide-binding domain-containing protein n=1 Tax=Exocentrus adspersus TaxID=1586481 RepID=A0AAV8VGL4_9CUCU|nr:hypothetical protein NQ315_016155 [Exocentrus adspersus]